MLAATSVLKRTTMTSLLKIAGRFLKAVGTLAGIAYFILAVVGYGSLFGLWWALAAFVIPPIDLVYPFAVWAKFGFVPWPMVGLLVGAPLTLLAGLLLLVVDEQREDLRRYWEGPPEEPDDWLHPERW